MNDHADEQRWLHIVTALVPRSTALPLPLTFAKEAEARWVSATSLPEIPDSRTNSASVEVLERLSATTVVICWADATAGRYGEQTWTLRVARRQGVCPLSGEPFAPGAPVYRPNLRQRRVNQKVQPIAAATIERLERGEPVRRSGK
jgi:hypothetical protein